MLRSSCLARMSPTKHTLFTFRTKVRTVRLSFLATRYNFQASSWLVMHSLYLSHLVEIANGSRHALAINSRICAVLCVLPVYNQLLALE